MRWQTTAVVVAAVVGMLGCTGGDFQGSPAGSPAGVTPGGAQDIEYARTQVANGVVPRPESLVAEGLYSEHDLPLSGPGCDAVLCLASGVGIAPALDTGRREAFVQVGFSSNVELATFRRQPLNVSLLIDRSGSMAGASIAAVKTAAHKLVEQLDEGDLLSIVLFDDQVDVLRPPSAVTDREELNRAIDSIQERGSTCIECGLRKSFELLAQTHGSTRASRVLLFTDAMPNVGATGEGEFMELLEENAARGLEATVFGMGMDFGQALVTRISATHGANYVYLSDAERTARIFDEDFAFLVTPVAYDLQLQLAPAVEHRLEAAYGLPGVEPGASQAELKVATLFLSRRHGAIVLRLTGEAGPGTPVLTGEFSVRTREGSTLRSSLSAGYGGTEPLAEGGTWFSQPSVRKSVALTHLFLGAREACRLWHAGDRVAARTLAERTAALMKAEADATGDSGLKTEADFAAALARLMAA